MAITKCPNCNGSAAIENSRCPVCGLTPSSTGMTIVTPTPAILDWAKAQFSEEEIIAGIDEIRQTGGLELHEFLHELEMEASASE